MKRLFYALLCGANACTILFLWIVCASTWLEPSQFPRMSQAGLLMPAALAANALFLIIWFAINLKGLLIPILGMLPAYGFILDYCPLNPDKDEHANDTTESLRVVSFNACNWSFTDSTDGEWNAKLLLDTLNADIICLQESAATHWRIRKKLKAMGYECRGVTGTSVCSRLPFVGDSIIIDYEQSQNNLTAWHLKHGEDTIFLVNVHLQSTKLPPDEKKHFNEHLHSRDKEQLEQTGRLMLNYLSQAAVMRSTQTAMLDSVIRSHEGESIILCGDFNETPISYSYQKMKHRLKSCFRESGLGLGFSYNNPGFWVRIDHIFTSDDWMSTNTHIVRTFRCSDHYPIVTTLHKREHKGASGQK